MTITILLACFPVLLVLFLLLYAKMAADKAGLIAFVITLIGAWLWCGTAPNVLAGATLSGIIGSLPVVLVMAASMFQIIVMEEAGAMQRLVAFMKSTAPGNKVVQIMLLNVGFGILLTSLGVTTVAILPPIMLALGYASFAAILLPAIGYEALCTYALLGVPVVVFSGLGGIPVQSAGVYFASFMPLMSLCIAFAMLYLVGGFKLLKEGFVPALIAGLAAGFTPLLLLQSGMVTLTGVFAGLAVILALFAYLKLTGKALSDPSALSPEDKKCVDTYSLWRALAPWILLIGISLLLNSPLFPFFDFTFKTLAMPVEIIPGAPENLRIFWQPWFWVFVSTFLCLPVLKVSPSTLKRCAVKTWKRSFHPCLTAIIFFALAYVMNQSGKNADWQLVDATHNMIRSLASASAFAFGTAYPFIAPFLGLAGGFLAGSQTSSLAMFTQLHMVASETIGANGLYVAAASGVGGGLASVISPSKVQLACASIDKPEEASRILKPALIAVLLITAILGLISLYMAY